jgi:hypothetical protein
MPAGDLVYKCRNCDAPPESIYYYRSDLYHMLDYALDLARPPIGCDMDNLPARYATHTCRDGTRGVMDLIGARPASAPSPGVAAQASRSQGRDAADAA